MAEISERPTDLNLKASLNFKFGTPYTQEDEEKMREVLHTFVQEVISILKTTTMPRENASYVFDPNGKWKFNIHVDPV